LLISPGVNFPCAGKIPQKTNFFNDLRQILALRHKPLILNSLSPFPRPQATAGATKRY
jgi:hypothetical protein